MFKLNIEEKRVFKTSKWEKFKWRESEQKSINGLRWTDILHIFPFEIKCTYHNLKIITFEIRHGQWKQEKENQRFCEKKKTNVPHKKNRNKLLNPLLCENKHILLIL